MGLVMSSDCEPVTPFVESLGELKRSGSNLLVIGSVPNEIHHTICKQMLGRSPDTPRCRVVVFSNADDQSAKDDISTLMSASPTPIHTINTASQPLTAFEKSDTGRKQVARVDATDDRLDDVKTIIIKTIDQLEEANNGFVPAELRVCFSMHLQLFDNYEKERVSSVIRSMARRIEQSNGMGHFHLSSPSEQQFRSYLARCFDGIVRLDSKEGTPYQRWYLRDSDTTSEWFPIDSARRESS
jgi:hypothetical protein